jgi:hypothetical protein
MRWPTVSRNRSNLHDVSAYDCSGVDSLNSMSGVKS